MTPVWRDWERAWADALYGAGGLVHDGSTPGTHYRTSVHVGAVLAEAVAELLARVDTRLAHPARLDLVDAGAGGGELLVGVRDCLGPALRARVHPVAVDLRAPPAGWALPWRAELPTDVHGLVVAHELLDAVPCPVVTRTSGVLRRVQVDEPGRQRPGPGVGGAERRWLERWGAPAEGACVEVGLPRDALWARVLAGVRAGSALAVDYGVEQPADTLAGYRRGVQVHPVPDARTDLTAHVHWPSVRALHPGVHRTQAAALAGLGAGAPRSADDWLAAAERAGHRAELTDLLGLGGFGWWWVSR